MDLWLCQHYLIPATLLQSRRPFPFGGPVDVGFLLLPLRAIGFDGTPVSRRGSGRSALDLSNCFALYEIAALFYVIWKISKHAYAIIVFCLELCLFVCLWMWVCFCFNFFFNYFGEGWLNHVKKWERESLITLHHYM